MNENDNSKLVGCIGMDLDTYSYMKSNGTIKRIYIIDYQFTEGWTTGMEEDKKRNEE